MFVENLIIPKKDLNILNLFVYNTELCFDNSLISGLSKSFRCFYNKIRSNEIVFFEDLGKGKVKFVIAENDYPTFEEYKNNAIQSIKEFLGDSYTDDCIIYISEEERQRRLRVDEYRESKKIGDKIPWAEKAFCDFILDNYPALKTYCFFIDGVITENQFMSELINILANELTLKHYEALQKGHSVFLSELERLARELRGKDENN